jgi:nicotinate phosphoribosyltransferase
MVRNGADSRSMKNAIQEGTMDKLSLMTDLYELTMMQGYFSSGNREEVVFDMFFRRNPDDGGYAVMCGVAQLIEYIHNLQFDYDDIAYLKGLGIFKDDFLEYLRGFHFSGDIYAVPEGTAVFPGEPLVKVVAPIMEAQLIEPALLCIINHQTLIATKASRVCYAAGGGVMEFGLRRAQGPDAAVYGARAAVIGGCIGTSNVLAGRKFNIPVKGTHAHSWIMSFPDELTAFRNYAKEFPDACILLVDTYDTLRSGVPNAIKVFTEMREAGIKPGYYGIRLDSGDLAYLSKKARKMLDEAGFPDAVISASCDLDEDIILSLKRQGAQITSWGVGTRMITSFTCPSLGGVYKLAAIKDPETGEYIPKIKVSDNPEKVTNPGNKEVWRICGKEDGKIIADLISLADEKFTNEEDLLIFDPVYTWKKTLLKAGTYTIKKLLVPIYKKGFQVYESPDTMAIRDFCASQLDSLWDETRRFANPHMVYIDLSDKLYNLKKGLLDNIHKED